MGRKIAETFHPSFSIVEGVESREWTQVEFARRLGISAQYANDLLHAKRGISPRIAVALEHAGMGSAEYWLKMQASYDLSLYRSILRARKEAL